MLSSDYALYSGLLGSGDSASCSDHLVFYYSINEPIIILFDALGTSLEAEHLPQMRLSLLKLSRKREYYLSLCQMRIQLIPIDYCSQTLYDQKK